MKNIHSLKSFLTVLIVFIVLQCKHAAQVRTYSPKYGSYEGGTYLTITGSGFERDGQDGSTKVYIGSDLCQTIEYYTNDEQIVCITPPCTSDDCLNRQNDNYDINVVVMSISYNDIVYAGYWRYRDWVTPYLRNLEDTAGAAGDVLTAYGWLREDDVENFYPYVGELLCDPGDEDDEDLNGGEDDDIRYTLHCLIPNNVAGYYNFTLRTFDDWYGWGYINTMRFGHYSASFHAKSKTITPYEVTPDGKELYKVENFPTIHDVYPASGSILGGGKVTLTGTGFDYNNWENVEVAIGGLPCTISSVTDTEVICYTSAAGSCNGTLCEEPFHPNATWSGGRGLNVELFHYTQSISGPEKLEFMEPDEHYLNDASVFFDEYANEDYYGRQQAYFVPPFTAYYRFYLVSDDRGYIFLSTDESRENRTRICYSQYYSSSDYWMYDDQISEPIHLVQGKKYYYEAEYLDWGGWAHINAGVEIINASKSDIPDNTLHQYFNSLPERQTVTIKNVRNREIQDIYLIEVTSGKFYISYTSDDGTFTRSESAVSYDADAGTVVSAVESVQGCQSVSVARTTGYLSDNTTSYIKYAVTFGCATSSTRNDLIVESHSLVGDDWYVTRSQEPSVQFGGKLVWGIDQYWTRELDYNADYWTIMDAFDDVFREMGVPFFKVEMTWSDGNYQDGRTYYMDIHGFGNAPDIQVNTTLLTGDFDEVVVTTRNNGSANPFFEPIPATFFETLQHEPQVELWVNGMKASCRQGEEGHVVNFTSHWAGQCPYSFNVSSTPTVTGLLPEDGRIELGSLLTLYGTGFNSKPSQNIVWLGNYSDICNMTYASPNELQCEVVTNPPWGVHQLQLQVLPYGYAALEATLPQIHANLTIFNITSTTGGVWGGNSLTVLGGGFRFKNQTDILVGGKACETTYASDNKIVCSVPSVYGSAERRLTSVMATGEGFDQKDEFEQYFNELEERNDEHPARALREDLDRKDEYDQYFDEMEERIHGHPARALEGDFDGKDEYEKYFVELDGRNDGHKEYFDDVDALNLMEYKKVAAELTHELSAGTTDMYLQWLHGHDPQRELEELELVDSYSYSYGFSFSYVFIDGDFDESDGDDEVSDDDDSSFSTFSPTPTPDFWADIEIDFLNFPNSYHYDRNITPVVEAIYPGDVSSAVSTILTLSGSKLDDTKSIKFGNQKCEVQTADYANVTCLLIRSTSTIPTTLEPEVNVEGVGYATMEDSILRGFSVQSVSPSIGSFGGGLEVTLEGYGFSPNYPETHSVIFHGYGHLVPCEVTNVTFNTLTCIVGEVFYNGSTSLMTSNVTVTLNELTSKCTGDCEFTFSMDNTPTVESISPSNTAPESSVAVTGTLFTDNMQVFIGEEKCEDVSVASSTSLVCTIPFDRFGEYEVKVLVDEYGSSLVNYDMVTFTQPLELLTLSSSRGSISGGLPVTLSGHGFSESETETTVLFGGHAASFIGLSHHSLEILTPSVEDYLSNGQDLLVTNVTVVINGSTTTLPDAFTFDASLNYTPQVTMFTPDEGWQGTIISIAGSGFGNYSSENKVEIGGEECLIIQDSWNVNGTEFNCSLGTTVHGMHWMYVTIANKGYAQDATSGDTLWFTSLVEVTGLAPATGSVGGGTRVTLYGRGLGSAHVEVCLQPATIVSTSYDTIVFETPALSTQTAYLELGHLESDILTGELYVAGRGSSTSDWYPNVFDGDYETYFQSWWSYNGDCYLGYQFASTWGVLISRIRYYPRISYSAYMNDGYFEVSLNGTSWTTIATIQNAREAWNYIDIEMPEPVNYIRYVGPPSGRCYAAEIEFYGVEVSRTPTCNLTLAVNDNPINSAVSGHTFTYEVDQTPLVTSISPRMGTAMGGTLVTLKGEGFSTEPTNNTVIINTFNCEMVFSNETTLMCQTSPRWTYELPSLSVHVEGKGYAVMPNGTSTTTYFRYLDQWSALTTWANNEPPLNGDTVFVPAGQSVLLDVPSPKLYLLLVQGDLVFDRADLSLEAHYIFIYGGTFEIGTEDEPFEQNAVVTLYGRRFSTMEIPHVGGKMIAVADVNFVAHGHDGGMMIPEEDKGYLDIHGKPRKRTWCKLSQSSMAGDTIIHLAEEVDWEAGETIIVTASREGAYDETEEVVVKQRIDDQTIELETELLYDHESNIYFIEGHRVDMRVEAGLLSRNIIIQGDEDAGRDQFGVHTVAAHGGVYRVENAEFTRCGQAFFLGRYCTHMHMASRMDASYVKSNSIHHSFQRAVTIHGSHFTNVAHNVAFDVKGHTYFVEDGAEFYNVIEGNLGALTKISEALLSSDLKASTFWTATPRNIWRHNVAAGSQVFGWWLEFPSNPGGPSATTDICPRKDHLIEFFNNTAHTNRGFGFRVYPQYTPLEDPCDDTSDPYPVYFYNSTSFRNGGNGQFGKKLGSLHWIYSKYVENGGAQVFWIKMEFEKFLWNPHYRDSLFVGSLTGEDSSRLGIWAPQDEFFYGSGLTFVNFTGGSSGVLAGCNCCRCPTKFNQGGQTYRYDRLKFVNVDKRTIWMWPYKDIVWDVDGSLAGVPNGSVTPYYAYNEFPGCVHEGEKYDNGLVCNSSYFPRRLQVYGVEPEELDFQDMEIASEYGTDYIPFETKEFYGWCVPIVGNARYDMGWDSTVDFQEITMRYSEPEYVEYSGWDEWLGASFSYIDYREFYEVISDGRIMPVLNGSDPPGSNAKIGSSTINHVNQTWHMMMSTVGTMNSSSDPLVISARALQCDPYVGCGTVVAAPVVLQNKTYWSDAETWGAKGVPQAGDDVVINSTMWVVLDQDTGILNSLVVNGKLEVADDGDIVLETKKMSVWGIFEAGKPNQPLSHDFELVLHGERTSPTLIIDNGHFLGNKVLAVLGRMTMVGIPRVTHTRLASTAEAGDTTIYLQDPTDWHDDEIITLTPTEYDTSQLEMVEIDSVSDGGRTIELKTPLQHTHIAETVDLDDESIEFASAVGLLTRNVRIRGEVTNGAMQYGGSVYVIDASNVDGSIVRAGTVYLENVEFKDTGKHLSEHASLTFKYVYEHEHGFNFVRSCAFSNSSNYGIRLMDIDNVIIQNNTIHKTYRVGIDIDDNSANAVVTGNLIAGTLFSEDDPDEYILPRSGIHTESMPSQISHNIIGGAFDTGITFYPDECGASTIFNNEVHSAKIGAALLWKTGCREMKGFKAWKISDIAVLTVDQLAKNLSLSNLIIADSHIGISLNYIPKMTETTIIIKNSVIIGTSILSDCDQSLECRAATEEDNIGLSCGSTLQDENIRHTGIMTPQFTRTGKTCFHDSECEFPDGRPINMISMFCSMPWEKRFGMGIGTHFAEMYISDVTFYGFSGFNGSDCGMNSVAVINNPSEVDYTPPIYMSGISWQNTAHSGKFLLNLKNSFTLRQPKLNLDYNDGIDMIVVHDVDGSMLDNIPGGFITTNLLLAADHPHCAGVEEWGAYWCDDSMVLRAAMFESLDSDRGGRRIGPIKITRENGVAANRTYWTAGPIDEPCRIDLHVSQYQFFLQANTSNQVYATGTLPSNIRIKFFSKDPSESVLLKIWTNKPDGVNVFLGDTLIESAEEVPTLEDSDGTNGFDPQAMFMYLTMRGGGEYTYTIRRTPVVQVTFHLEVESIEFFDEDLLISNLALLLDIDSSRIKVVDVRIGSVYADVEISDDETVVNSNDDDVVAESYETLTALAISIVQSASEGTLDVGYEVLELAVEAPTMDLSNSTANSSSAEASLLELLGVTFIPAPLNITKEVNITDVPTDMPTYVPTDVPTDMPTSTPTTAPTEMILLMTSSSEGLSSVQWGGLVAVVLLVALGGTFGCLWYRRKKRRKVSNPENEAAPHNFPRSFI